MRKKKMLLNQYKRILKIISFYLIGLLCIACYYWLDNSSLIPELVEKADKYRYSGFPIFLITGLFKYGLLVSGLGIIIMLSFLLIKKQIQNHLEN